MKKILLTLLSTLAAVLPAAAEGEVTATLDDKMAATMSNGIITLKIGADGRAGTMYHKDSGTTNLLGSSGIYFDYTADKNRALAPTKAELVKLTDDYAEILYTCATPSLINYQHGYILRKDDSCVYTYVVVNGNSAYTTAVKETRVCTRLASTFLDGYVDDTMQGRIPSNSEMSAVENDAAAKVQDATYRMADGSIYTKYDWANFIDRDDFHGLMNGKMGVWNIPVSYEWLNGGPMRQELTVHATGKSPITIQMLQGEHLGGAAQVYATGERQLFGPFAIYVNSGDSREEMIADARAKAAELKAQWPFGWFGNELYPLDRSTVTGRINMLTGNTPADIQVVLAEPQRELIRQGKKYMFWAKTDADGNFSIPNVRKGEYALHAYATTGTVTDELEVADVKVDSENTDLGVIDWSPCPLDNLIWSIGENNRLADGFRGSDTPRAYGWWSAMPSDLTYTIGTSEPSSHWYNGQTRSGSWRIEFTLDKQYAGDVTLTASLAGVTNGGTIGVIVNGKTRATWNLSSNDGAIYRSATQAGRHTVQTCVFDGSVLKVGSNRITFSMTAGSGNGGVLYDCVKLEGSPADSAVAVVGGEAAPYELFSIAGLHVGQFGSLERLPLPDGVYIWRRGAESGKICVR